MKRFNIYGPSGGQLISVGVQFPDGSLAQSIDGKVIPTQKGMAGFYLQVVPLLGFRVEWID